MRSGQEKRYWRDIDYVWYGIVCVRSLEYTTYYTSVQHDYISITRVHHERKQHASLKRSPGNEFAAHHKQRENKTQDSFFFFFLRKLFIESINLIIRFLATIVYAYICSKINIDPSMVSRKIRWDGEKDLYFFI